MECLQQAVVVIHLDLEMMDESHRVNLRQAGIEPATCGLGGLTLYPLSYRRVRRFDYLKRAAVMASGYGQAMLCSDRFPYAPGNLIIQGAEVIRHVSE